MKKIILIVFLLSAFIAQGQMSQHLVEEIEHPTNYIKTYLLHQQGLAFYDVKRISLPGGPSLEYAEQGDEKGLPIIFLHGLSDSWHSFKSVLPLLPPNIHAIAITQRGHGDSEKPLNGYAPKDFAADVAAFIREKNLGPVVIAGHSMGGIVAQQFAVLYPELTKALVIISSDAAMGSNPGAKEFISEVRKMEGEVIDREFMSYFQQSTLTKPIDSVYFAELVNEGLKMPLPVFKKVLNESLKTDLRNDIKKIKQPALIMWGDKDGVCHLKGQQVMRKNIPSSTLKIYKGSGHGLHWEEPEIFTTDLLQFINSKLKN